MLRYGKGTEKTVLARVLRYRIEERVASHGNKTVVVRGAASTTCKKIGRAPPGRGDAWALDHLPLVFRTVRPARRRQGGGMAKGN